MNSAINLAICIVVSLVVAVHAVDGDLAKGHPYNNGTFAKGYVEGKRNSEAFIGTLVITPQDRQDAKPAVDWTFITSPVKNQGSCGSCWAYSTAEGIETAVYVAAGQKGAIDLFSEQQITSCDHLSGDNGCAGGDPMGALDYVNNIGGLDTQADYPDNNAGSSTTTPCTWDGQKVALSLNWWYTVAPCEAGACTSQDEDGMAAAVSKHGPMTVCLNANWPNNIGWTFDGVYPGLDGTCSSDRDKVDHCVQVVGYDRTGTTLPPYWLIRNSWSANWGDNGYIRIPYGSNACGIANRVFLLDLADAGAKMEKPPEPKFVQDASYHSMPANPRLSAADNTMLIV